ncbi:hypothetical protein [Bradyrhizobium mercantei]|uniref:hypothetical protein n=1 Tax=Bradyrhizobium mercantei TaxID=1904807 RepID=UPI003221C850
MIVINAIEVDHGFASHLVSSDFVAGDQLISLRPSKFAVAAAILEFDEPTPLIAIVVSHGTCMRFNDLCRNRIKPAEPHLLLKGYSKGVVRMETMANSLDGLLWRNTSPQGSV